MVGKGLNPISLWVLQAHTCTGTIYRVLAIQNADNDYMYDEVHVGGHGWGISMHGPGIDAV